MIGRVGPAFETYRKFRIISKDGFKSAYLPRCYVWSEADYIYYPVQDERLPIYPGEFVDTIRVEFNAGIRYFIARQLDELIAAVDVETWDKLMCDNNDYNFWLEEI